MKEQIALIADFLENGLEHCENGEALDYLEQEFGIDTKTGSALIEKYWACASGPSMVPTTILHAMIENFCAGK